MAVRQMQAFRVATVVVGLFVFLAGCSDTPEAASSTSTTLGEVPTPHQVTCDLATEVGSQLEAMGRLDIFKSGRVYGGADERAAAETEGGEQVDVLYALAANADVVAMTDPWARFVADRANGWRDFFRAYLSDTVAQLDTASGRGVAPRFDALLSLCEGS
jgi:hypothetical protein